MDIVTGDYRKFILLRKYLKYSTFSFIVLTCLVLLFIGKTALEIRGLKKQIARMRAGNSGLQAVSDRFCKIRPPIQEKTKIIDAILVHNNEPSPVDFLVPFARINAKNMDIESIAWDYPPVSASLSDTVNSTVNDTGNDKSMANVSGRVSAKTYTGKEAALREFTGSLSRIDGVKNVHYCLNVRDNTFRVAFEFTRLNGVK